jgi:transcriptional regulator with XRE-family HTH domain/tetratricopeptide (TPR) repeat protein
MERTKLIQARKRKHWTQQQAAVRSEVDAKTYYLWEKGMTQPRLYNIQKLCEVYGRSEAELGLGIDDPGELDLEPRPMSTRKAEQDEIPLQFLHTIKQGIVVPSSDSPHTLVDPIFGIGSKLSHLLTTIEHYCTQPQLYLELQIIIGKELNEMSLDSQNEASLLSRRQLLITLATLPTASLLASLQGQLQGGQIEQFLGRCTAGIAACWQLLKGSEYTVVEEILPAYLSLLTLLARTPSSKYRSTAASLATQAYRLKGILAYHRDDVKARDAYFQQALYYAEIALDPGLLVVALISVAYQLPDPLEAEQFYQRALVYEQTISPLQRSRLYAGVSITYAQQNREDEALRYLRLAGQEYPVSPKADPSTLYTDFGPFSMIRDKGKVYLALAAYHPDRHHPQQAWETFAAAESGQSTLITPERIRYQVVNYQAETALALQDRDLCCEYLERGAQGAVLLGSAKRQREVISTREKALKLWPHEERVKELKYLFG